MGFTVHEISEGVKSCGEAQFVGALASDIEKNGIPNGFSVRTLWEGLYGSLHSERSARFLAKPEIIPINESIGARTFDAITGNVIINQMRSAYNDAPSVLDRLVTRFNSNIENETIPAFSAMEGPSETNEAEPFPLSGVGEESVLTDAPKKIGMAVEVTREAIQQDKTGMILLNASNVGKWMRKKREENGMKRIQDLTAFKVFRPKVAGASTQTDLWRTSAAGTAWYNKSITKLASTALADWTDVNAALQLLVNMTDAQGNPIGVPSRLTLLVPPALAATAAYIVDATGNRQHTTSAAVETIGGNTLKGIKGVSFDYEHSVYMADATTWYLGDFKAQYYEQVMWDIGVREISADGRREIVAAYVGSYKGRVHAADDKSVIQVAA